MRTLTSDELAEWRRKHPRRTEIRLPPLAEGIPAVEGEKGEATFDVPSKPYGRVPARRIVNELLTQKAAGLRAFAEQYPAEFLVYVEKVRTSDPRFADWTPERFIQATEEAFRSRVEAAVQVAYRRNDLHGIEPDLAEVAGGDAGNADG